MDFLATESFTHIIFSVETSHHKTKSYYWDLKHEKCFCGEVNNFSRKELYLSSVYDFTLSPYTDTHGVAVGRLSIEEYGFWG